MGLNPLTRICTECGMMSGRHRQVCESSALGRDNQWRTANLRRHLGMP